MNAGGKGVADSKLKLSSVEGMNKDPRPKLVWAIGVPKKKKAIVFKLPLRSDTS